MPSQPKAKLSERGYSRFVWLGVTCITIAVVSSLAHAAIYLQGWGCGPAYDSMVQVPVCLTARSLPNAFVVIAVLIVGIGLAVWAAAEREHWYRLVVKGDVVALEQSPAVTGAYFVYVEGKTLNNETRVFKHPVSLRAYLRHQVGDYIDLE